MPTLQQILQYTLTHTSACTCSKQAEVFIEYTCLGCRIKALQQGMKELTDKHIALLKEAHDLRCHLQGYQIREALEKQCKEALIHQDFRAGYRLTPLPVQQMLGRIRGELESSSPPEKYSNEQGDWGYLPLEPCRFCREQGGVYFQLNEGQKNLNDPQVVQCRKCGKDWAADSPLA